MNLVTEWVMQIIVFILLGTIVELLLPNNSMKKYVNIVVGLLLLLILTKPILYLFSVDVTYQLEQIERAIFQEGKQFTETENLVEKQKKEIQAEQDAYILNEVKLQLMNEVNPILHEQYSVQIMEVAFSFDEPVVDNYEDLEKVIVTLTTNPVEIEPENDAVKPIVIETQQKEQLDRTSNPSDTKIINTLKEVWGLDDTQIQIVWEGGTS